MEHKDYAYPVSMGHGFTQKGITKREYFAAMAMQGLCANTDFTNANSVRISELSYELSDAMIAESEKETTK